MISYYKGEFLTHTEIPINDNLFRGLGAFETIKFINQKMIFFNDHIDRLFSNTRFFNFNNINKNEIDTGIAMIRKALGRL